MVDLVALAQATQDGDGLLHVGLVHEDRLEAALQGGVLLDVLAVFVERGGADGVQLAPGQHRLEQVGGVHGPLRGAGADDGVQLVDEEHDPAVGVLDLLEHGLEPLLELAAELGACDERPQVQAHHSLPAQAVGHIAAHDALGEALDDGGLAHTRLADEDGVVLGPTGEDLDDATDLLVAPHHRVELAGTRGSGQVDAVLLQRLVGPFRVGAGHALAAADGLERAEQGLMACPARLQQTLAVAARLARSQQQVLRGDVFVAQLARLLLGRDDQLVHAWVEPQLAAFDARPASERGRQVDADGGRVCAQLAQGHDGDALGVVEEGSQQVLHVEHG